MIDEYELAIGYSDSGEHHNQDVNVEGDYICCPRCESIHLLMGKISTPNKIMERECVIIEFTCTEKECSAELSLALYNEVVHNYHSRINWVEKVVPYVEDTVDKLESFSLTGQSKKLKSHVEKHNLWDLKSGEELPEGVPPYRSEDYDKGGNDKVVNIKDKKNPL
jgi:hypothetical protein